MANVPWIARIVPLVLLMNPSVWAEKKGHPLQSYSLTDEMIAQAIEEGGSDKRGTVGLALRDSVSKWVNRATWRPSTEGFSVEIYTPYTWIGQQARLAARGGKAFSTEDVTEDMTDCMLRVVANPDMPLGHPSSSTEGTSGVDHVIIRSTSEENFEVLQPVEIEDVYAAFRYGTIRTDRYSRKLAVFDLQAVADIARLDDEGEFIVVVIGTEENEERMFLVKTKHFDQLR